MRLNSCDTRLLHLCYSHLLIPLCYIYLYSTAVPVYNPNPTVTLNLASHVVLCVSALREKNVRNPIVEDMVLAIGTNIQNNSTHYHTVLNLRTCRPRFFNYLYCTGTVAANVEKQDNSIYLHTPSHMHYRGRSHVWCVS